MKRESESESLPRERLPGADTARTGPDAAFPARETFGGAPIDFHTAEFNRTDDLSDCGGNYRDFETLDGIVTTHERHQIELRRNRGEGDTSRGDEAGFKPVKTPCGDAGAVGPLTVISEGRTLIVDTDADRALACARSLNDRLLSCTMLITGGATEGAPRSFGRTRLLRVDGASITGAFGGFSATVTTHGAEKALAECQDSGSDFDLVLDLQPSPSFAGGRLPMGYYAPGSDPSALAAAMAELPEMRGTFRKPQFITLYEDRCFHNGRGVHDCRQCVEICPAGAIRPVEGRISVNHHLCQGCGACALVCPADAFRVIQPSQEGLLKGLRESLMGGQGDGREPSTLLISDSGRAAEPAPQGSDERRAYFEVEQISHAGLEILLAAFACGARDILLVCGPQNPPNVIKAMEGHVQMARAVLQGLGLGEDRIRFLVASEQGTGSAGMAAGQQVFPEGPIGNSRIEPATFPPACHGRALVYAAAQHLNNQSGAPKPWLALPAGSPFGELAVDAAACTLCMACTSACPSGALSPDGNSPRLLFREFQCHQCGLCRETCPEGAIRLVPRLLLGPGATEARVALREVEPFRCVECGVPFASPAMIDRVTKKLAGHRMFASERQLRRLRMCGTCRARDALASREVGQWNP